MRRPSGWRHAASARCAAIRSTFPGRCPRWWTRRPSLFCHGVRRSAGGAARPGGPSRVVGARRASPYGLEMAYELGRGLGAAGVTVVSGLALGIDAAAHRGCLDAGGPAIAVLAGGPDVPYPRSNLGLYERIHRDGIAVSEVPAGHPARSGGASRRATGSWPG